MTKPHKSGDGPDLVTAVRALVFMARTSGGVAGRDEGLCTALDLVESLLPPMVGVSAGGDEIEPPKPNSSRGSSPLDEYPGSY